MLIFGIDLTINSQVTIGSGLEPNNGALLDLKESNNSDDEGNSTKGLLFPRVKLSALNSLDPMLSGADLTDSNKLLSHRGLVVYNTNATAPFTQGLYFWEGTKWVASGSGGSVIPVDGLETPNAGQIGIVDQLRFIYSPSIMIDVSNPLPNVSLDVYQKYVDQFTGTGLIKNADAEQATIPTYPREYFDYYVTGYDTAVFSGVGFSNRGVLTYNILTAGSAASYMNIVMVLRRTPRTSP